MNRRAFLSGLVGMASGIVVPEPARVYSFVGGWRDDPFVTLSVYHYTSVGELVHVQRKLARESELLFEAYGKMWRRGTVGHLYERPGLDVGTDTRLIFSGDGLRLVAA